MAEENKKEWFWRNPETAWRAGLALLFIIPKSKTSNNRQRWSFLNNQQDDNSGRLSRIRLMLSIPRKEERNEMYQKCDHIKADHLITCASSLRLEIACSLYQKLKEFLRIMDGHRNLRWQPRSPGSWREPTFQEFINHYNIKIMWGQKAGKEQ